MLPLIRQHRARIDQLCRQYGVRTLELFGSATDPSFDAERSDLDFMVEFADRKAEGAADRYFGLHEDLQTTFGRPVDLVIRGAIHNPYVLRTIDQQRLSLYAA